MISGLRFHQTIAQNKNHICVLEMATAKPLESSLREKPINEFYFHMKTAQLGLFTMQIWDIGPTANIQ